MSDTGQIFTDRILYRTPQQIRDIPNHQWEEWILSGELPFEKFSADRHCQAVLRVLIKATRRRLEAA